MPPPSRTALLLALGAASACPQGGFQSPAGVTEASGASTTDASTTDAPTTDAPTTDVSSTEVPPNCGDGVVDPGEDCDDANGEDDDACVAGCVAARCGDRHVWAGQELCDDGPAQNSDAYAFARHCDADCDAYAPYCGDETCQVAYENTNTCPDDCASVCGNGVLEGAEHCDDGTPDDEVDCDADCTAVDCGDGHVNTVAGEVCDDGNELDDDACVMCEEAFCGDGVVQVGVEDCDDGDMDPLDGCSADCVPTRRVFVTQQSYSGKFGGLIGADNVCQAHALMGDLDGTFTAWLSDSSTSAADRIDNEFDGYYVLVNGTTVAQGWIDLTDGFLDNPIERDEFGYPFLGNVYTWSNTSAAGMSLGESCQDWLSASNVLLGNAGAAQNANFGWTHTAEFSCDTELNLYCFENP